MRDYYTPLKVFDYGTEAVGSMMYYILGILLGIILLTLAAQIVMYVFRSVGLYSIAKRRGIHNPWLAWIPVANLWVLGSISDQYQYVTKGKVRNTRKVLLALGIPYACVSAIPNYVGICNALIPRTQPPAISIPFYYVSSELTVMGIVAPLSVIAMILGAVLLVYGFIALYKLYASCKPAHAVAFLVLSILFEIAQPILLFACRNQDEGMQPKQEAPQPEENE